MFGRPFFCFFCYAFFFAFFVTPFFTPFLTTFLYNIFGCHFWTPFFDAIFVRKFCTPFLEAICLPHFCKKKFYAIVGRGGRGKWALGTYHVISGPMRGLKINFIVRGHHSTFNIQHSKWRTLRLYDWPCPEGWVSENICKFCLSTS